jgi:hypothetical protein
MRRFSMAFWFLNVQSSSLFCILLSKPKWASRRMLIRCLSDKFTYLTVLEPCENQVNRPIERPTRPALASGRLARLADAPRIVSNDTIRALVTASENLLGGFKCGDCWYHARQIMSSSTRSSGFAAPAGKTGENSGWGYKTDVNTACPASPEKSTGSTPSYVIVTARIVSLFHRLRFDRAPGARASAPPGKSSARSGPKAHNQGRPHRPCCIPSSFP